MLDTCACTVIFAVMLRCTRLNHACAKRCGVPRLGDGSSLGRSMAVTDTFGVRHTGGVLANVLAVIGWRCCAARRSVASLGCQFAKRLEALVARCYRRTSWARVASSVT